MIYSLSGKLLKKGLDFAVVECAGVGYYVSLPLTVPPMLPSEGESASLYTYMSVREDAVELYGFADEYQRDTFRLLTGVSGVGAKVGLSILSSMTPESVAFAISAGDYKPFTACSGVGAKLAQRIVLELKGKATSFAADAVFAAGGEAEASAASEAVMALVALGFSQNESVAAVAKLPKDLDTSGLIQGALRALSGRR